MDAINIPLSLPIKAHGHELSAITLRPPKGGDFNRHGFPILIRVTDGEAVEESSPKAVAALAGELAGIPTSSVDQLEGADWLRVAETIRAFVAAAPSEGATLPFALRRLKGRELRLHGLPFLVRRLHGGLVEEINPPVLSAIMADLGGVSAAVVDDLEPAVWLEGVNAIRGFLADSTALSSSLPPGDSPAFSGAAPATSSS